MIGYTKLYEEAKKEVEHLRKENFDLILEKHRREIADSFSPRRLKTYEVMTQHGSVEIRANKYDVDYHAAFYVGNEKIAFFAQGTWFNIIEKHEN